MLLESADEFRRNVLGVRSASTVSHEIKPTTGLKAMDDLPGNLLEKFDLACG